VVVASPRNPAVLTPRQAEVLGYLREHQVEHGFAPTVDELSQACGLGSAAGAHRMLKTLEAKGYVRRSPGRSRAVTLVDDSPSLADATEAERIVARLICEYQAAARDSILRVAAEIEDNDAKSALLDDAVARHEVAVALGRELEIHPAPATAGAGAIEALLGAFRAGATWPEFVIDHHIWNLGSAQGATQFLRLHPALQFALTRVTELSRTALVHSQRWLDAVLGSAGPEEVEALRRRAHTMLQVNALGAELLAQAVNEEGVATALSMDDLPAALR
jgi:DNA-binding MarR family transcriptional regulator